MTIDGFSVDQSTVFIPNSDSGSLCTFIYSGVYKKLESAGKKRGCEKVKQWARSVSNHMYWCAASSDGDGQHVKEKWTSILNHVTKCT